jgi:hypothetical protein
MSPFDVQDEPIVITADEANSSHVDDLLKRQMSLRGEGVVAEPAKRWYYRNWLLFAIVGIIAAALAWALIEPNFDDYLYVQGSIEATGDDRLGLSEASAATVEEPTYGAGWVKIRGQQIWLQSGLRAVRGERIGKVFDGSTLKPGQEIGLYAKFYSGPRNDLAIAAFIDPAPARPARGKALQPLEAQSRRNSTTGFLIFSTVAGLIGLGIGATDGIVCRLPRRALIGGLIGLLIGFVGGLISHVFASVLYIPLNHLASEQMQSGSQGARSLGFLLQMVARMFAWTLAGSAMGLGQGIALRSKRLLGYGFLGGIIGGLLGGLLFDPIDLVILSGRVGAESSRLAGFVVIGAAVGAMIGIVELLARDAWLRMIEGPLAGKEFLIFRDVMNVGSSPRSEIYLFNDTKVAPTHATLRTIGDETEITARDRVHPLLVNGNPVKTARLRHGDRITIGATSFLFEQRQR